MTKLQEQIDMKRENPATVEDLHVVNQYRDADKINYRMHIAGETHAALA